MTKTCKEPPIKVGPWGAYIGAPAAWKCPVCGGEVFPEFDEAPDGSLLGTGRYYCVKGDYEYDEEDNCADGAPRG